MTHFEAQGLSFRLDRAGALLERPEPIDIELAYDDLELAPDDAPEALGARLSRLLGESVYDEEGLYDLEVTRGGAVVAALVLACEDEALALGGERAASVSDEELAAAIAEALAPT